ncbi:uncharacterized protein MONOS_5791 [Monocercomonoides exilis]|uniref:uncharacterized protein n=1 Tax=Monocercomonoides exilis TaxID=2049356 RepID=UPI00355A7355|nr:hypothetical protein MONOS_5791 [Monocercomonoides exilis]|eukprot:MONOS_5791.1-p1 / transcript=MONOS_5791.1 / gene=MONOS_5791 / organism=Monocercomonoides_exilis_PA203 / gene_product=unspecified product / transcript_product=unspecified product / location=Mono_scaffold00173:70272-71307(+) / protein_length=269 / sequence_SO=supercontig / SO=protein_coding / is_pseudo=false
MHLFWSGSRPGQRISLFSVILRIFLWGLISYYLINIAISIIEDISYVQDIRHNYLKTTCTLRNYSNSTIAVPYQDNLSQGSCAHFFDVTFPATQQKNASENNLTATISDLTYGTCTMKSRRHSHWKESRIADGQKAETHVCFYNSANPTLLLLALPESNIFSNLLVLVAFLSPPALVWGATLFYFGFKLLRKWFPTLGGPPAEEVVDEVGAAAAAEGAEGAENGDIELQQMDNADEPAQNANQHLTPAQLQMQAQGWFANPQAPQRHR